MATKICFQIPYADKDKAKGLGARWDKDLKQWYAPNESIQKQMLMYWKETLPAKKQKFTKISNFFDVPYDQATLAEAKGAEWDFLKKRYVALNDDIHNELANYWDQLPEPITQSCFIELEHVNPRDNIPEDEIFTSWYFEVPYIAKNECKQKLHASWDNSVNKWKANNKYMWEQMRIYFVPYDVSDTELPTELPNDDNSNNINQKLQTNPETLPKSIGGFSSAY